MWIVIVAISFLGTFLEPFFLYIAGLSCMSANCDSVAAEDFVLAHISVENVRDMYNQLSFRDFVLSHPQLRFCPGTNCKLIIKAVLPVAKRVHCTSCKSSFWWVSSRYLYEDSFDIIAFYFYPKVWTLHSNIHFVVVSNVLVITTRLPTAKPSNAGWPNALMIVKQPTTFQLIQKT